MKRDSMVVEEMTTHEIERERQRLEHADRSEVDDANRP